MVCCCHGGGGGGWRGGESIHLRGDWLLSQLGKRLGGVGVIIVLAERERERGFCVPANMTEFRVAC